jgi:predicted O-methyltransferase YrrM
LSRTPLLSGVPTFVRAPVGAAMRAVSRRLDGLHSDSEATAVARSVVGKSMLHQDTLAALYRHAYRCRGAILELGSFVGGATIVLAKAAKASRNPSPVIAVEVGGIKEHDVMPTADILADLRSNLLDHNVHERVTVVPGWSNMVSDEVKTILNGQRIGLLVIDADGIVERDFEIYRPLLEDNASLVVDDYNAENNVKPTTVYPWIQRMVAEGRFKQTAVLPYGTWFGTCQAS